MCGRQKTLVEKFLRRIDSPFVADAAAASRTQRARTICGLVEDSSSVILLFFALHFLFRPTNCVLRQSRMSRVIVPIDFCLCPFPPGTSMYSLCINIHPWWKKRTSRLYELMRKMSATARTTPQNRRCISRSFGSEEGYVLCIIANASFMHYAATRIYLM